MCSHHWLQLQHDYAHCKDRSSHTLTKVSCATLALGVNWSEMNPAQLAPMPAETGLQTQRSAMRLALVYALVSCLWLIFADRLVGWLFGDPSLQATAHSFKDWLFIIATSLVAFVYFRRYLNQAVEQSRLLLAVQEELVRTATRLQVALEEAEILRLAQDSDLTALRLAAESQEHANRRAEGLLELPMLAEQLSEKDFLQHGLELAERLTASEIAFIHFVHDDQDTIELVNWSSGTLKNYCKAAFDNHYPVSQAGIWADALRQREPIVVNDYATATGKRGLPVGHARLDRLISVPVIEDGLVRMMAGVGNKASDYSDLDVETVRLVCETVWRIARQRRAESELRASEERLKLSAQVLAQGREGIAVTDAEGCIILVNQAFTDITGYAEAEVLGKNPRLLKSGRHGSDFFEAMWETIRQNGVWAGEVWNRKRDGSLYPEWLVISALNNARGEVTHYVGTFGDLSSAKAAENRILWLSHFDALTGLPNRTLLSDRATLALGAAHRAQEVVAFLMVSVDQFGSVSESLGHHLGDQLLVAVAQRIKANLREQDIAARLDGNDFVLLLPDTTPNGAAHRANHLIAMIAQPIVIETHEINVTASVGIASFPENGQDFEALLTSVAIALHKAQAKARGTYQFFNNDMYKQVVAREELGRELRNAIALDQLSLLYQPQANLRTGKICGLEALLRWSHPDLGLVLPAKFIPLAEESGLVVEIGEWVFRRVCRDIRLWRDKNLTVPHVSVNVSLQQFYDASFLATVKSSLVESQIDAEQIFIEVTEGSLMDDVPRCEGVIHSLKDLGFKMSLDDFGTGYSSLSYLKRFSFDQVKIDQLFVSDVTRDSVDTMLVKVIVSMAHGLGMKVIAEGVETEAQCEIIRSSGCDEIQGYFYSHPIEGEQLEQFLSGAHALQAHLLHPQKPQRTLLLVDDEPNILTALKRLFRRDGHKLLTAASGAEALEILSQHKVDVIITDQRMPGMTGVELLRCVNALYPDTIRIVLSGYTELQSVTDAINEGAVYRFLTKPWDDELLREQIRKAFAVRDLTEENRDLDAKIRSANQELVAANRHLAELLDRERRRNQNESAFVAETEDPSGPLP
jgi:diguanylate cyclase (GGDEF)-like protein/PAS domain S-box-containing protein